MKKRIAMLMILALAVGMLAGCGAEPQAADQPVIKIGIFEPFTGANGAGGKQEALGISYANKVQPTVEIGGVTYRVELEVADNESSEKKAPTAAASLIANEVSVVLGSYGSDEALAGSPMFEAAGIPVVGVSCTNPAITAGNQHYFRICWLDTFQGSALANFAQEHLNAGKVYCLAERDDNYSAGLCSYFIEAFTALGGEVVYESFPKGTTDFAPYIQSAKREGANAFFAPVSTESAAWLIVQASEEKLGMPMLAGDTWDSNVVSAAGADENMDIYITTFFDETARTEGSVEFMEGFRKYINGSKEALALNGGNDQVSAYSAMGYDAYFVVLEAMKNAGSADPAAIQEALWSTSWSGITGEIAFGPETGDAVRNAAYIKRVNKNFGTWEFVTIQELKD